VKKVAIIIGAGPAGLTAALELLRQTDIQPIVLERSNEIGGISRTVQYNGNRIDIGGHRFFSKSEKVMNWWQEIMPLQSAPAYDDKLLNRSVPLSNNSDALDPEKSDNVLLTRDRLSRILYLRKLFDYPISLSWQTLSNLGFIKIIKIGLSYLRASIKPIIPEKTLEEFFINRFGKELYLTFFKDYTQKVWGVPCREIQAEWGAQRIKGLSIGKSLVHAIKKLFLKEKLDNAHLETSLIEQFWYPKFGPGQMWENVAKNVIDRGAKIQMSTKVIEINHEENSVHSVVFERSDGTRGVLKAEYIISTMPVKELIDAMGETPVQVKKVSEGLLYRDFITVGLLLNKLSIRNETDRPTLNHLIPDNWIYVQENDVFVGRLQFFNNWSPYLVADKTKVWIGLEYFCNEGDATWSKNDEEMKRFAIEELVQIGMLDKHDVIDSIVIRVPKAYPAYFGTYDSFHMVQEYVDAFENLFLIGRNGMHRYNNMDHSMLTAMKVVENIKHGIISKEAIWKVNAEKEYHEER
jgi:protoporphyrinogen oxidase